MFIILPDVPNALPGKTITMHLAQHGERDASMMFALIGRVRPDLVPGLAWGLFGTSSTQAAMAKRQRAAEARRPEVEFRVVPIQHGFDPYCTDAADQA